MAQFSPADLAKLLEYPNESLTVEHKDWLDLSGNAGKGTLAKAAIALANHGGGVIVLGMRRHEDRGPLGSQRRPESMRRYDQDEVNSSINKFAEPEIHCELSFADHPATGVEHAFVLVPGDISVPVMAKVTANGVIDARKCYIRKPGPKSEEPFEATEWRAVLDRCVRARRDEMLEAIRTIISGSAPIVDVNIPASASADKLIEFSGRAIQRWNRLIDPLGKDDPARFPHGRYQLTFEILGVRSAPTLAELRAYMEEASRVKHTGWGPFVLLTRQPYRPAIIEDAIEAWLGSPGESSGRRDPAHSDLWRASPSGRLTLMRGFDEDGDRSKVVPGTAFDITLPVWRVGEAVLYVSRLAQAFGENLAFVTRCDYAGLKGRKLVSLTGRRWLFDERMCSDSDVSVQKRFTASDVRDNLAAAMQEMLAPLYARFEFYELPLSLVADELREMTSNKF